MLQQTITEYFWQEKIIKIDDVNEAFSKPIYMVGNAVLNIPKIYRLSLKEERRGRRSLQEKLI